MSKKTARLIAAVAGLAFMAGSTSAATIGIDFNVGTSPTTSGEPSNAAGLSIDGPTTWYGFTVAANTNEQSVVTSGGTFTINPGGSGNSFLVFSQISGGFDDFRGDIIAMNTANGHTSPVVWSLTGLAANTEYEIIFFNRGYTGAYTTVDGVGVGATEGTERDYDFASVTSDGTGKISGTFSAATSSQWYSWSGLQFAAVPEPGSLALLGLGGLLVGTRRRRGA